MILSGFEVKLRSVNPDLCFIDTAFKNRQPLYEYEVVKLIQTKFNEVEIKNEVLKFYNDLIYGSLFMF